jgi:hypothetical protein
LDLLYEKPVDAIQEVLEGSDGCDGTTSDIAKPVIPTLHTCILHLLDNNSITLKDCSKVTVTAEIKDVYLNNSTPRIKRKKDNRKFSSLTARRIHRIRAYSRQNAVVSNPYA